MTRRKKRAEIAEALTRAVDRPAVLRELIGTPEPRLLDTLPGDPRTVEGTRQAIGSVRLMEQMTPCDEALLHTVRRQVADRDIGDECGCGDC